MIKWRWASFARVHALQQEVRLVASELWAGREIPAHRLHGLMQLQRTLVKEITRAERKIRRIKEIISTLKIDADELRRSRLDGQLKEYRQIAYVWRCFGDFIAFLFIDKFSLKQTYFNTNNVGIKQGAGFLLDKEGFAREWEVVCGLIRGGVPALLCDLTNTIRHGDVCVLLPPDPILWEIKTGKVDRRGRRQRDSIRKLMEFFENDEVEGLRGFDHVRRVSHSEAEVLYVDEFNECVSSALDKGYALCSPEDGLYYIVIADPAVGMEKAIGQIDLVRPLLFSWNELKNERAWAPYSPFTISIKNVNALFGFIWEDLYIVVLYDVDAFCRKGASIGVEIELLSEDPDSIFEIRRQSSLGRIRISTQMFLRVAYDLTSPAWVLNQSLVALDRNEREVPTGG